MARLLSLVGCRGTSFPVCALDSTVLLALRQSWLPFLRVGSVNGVIRLSPCLIYHDLKFCNYFFASANVLKILLGDRIFSHYIGFFLIT